MKLRICANFISVQLLRGMHSLLIAWQTCSTMHLYPICIASQSHTRYKSQIVPFDKHYLVSGINSLVHSVSPIQIPLSIYFILHTSYHQFLSLNHYHHPSIPYSFVTGFTPTCFINPSHIRLSAFLRTASMDYRTRTGSSLLIDLEL